MLDQVSSGKILKKSSKNMPPKKTKDFTEQQTTALLDIALTSSPSTDPTSLGRNIPEPYPKPTADTDHEKLPAPSSQPPMSKKTRLDQVHPGKILKKPSKNKPLEKAAKVVTEASTVPHQQGEASD